MKSSSVPPPTQYRDDPSHSYRDIPTDDEENVPSIFDWGDSSAPSEPTVTNSNNSGSGNHKSKTPSSTSFDPNVEIPFTPISLHDEDEEEEEDDDSDVSGSNVLRPHNGFMGNVISRRGGGGSNRRHEYGPVGIEDGVEHKGRLFVGGGWGRHGSTTNCCSCQRRSCFSCGFGGGTGCLLVVFVVLTLLSGFLGYEAGLPVQLLDTTTNNGTTTTTTLSLANDATNDNADNDDDDDGFETTQHTTTHGDLWLEWLQHEKSQIHLPHLHLNFTRHNPIITTNSKTNQLQLSFPSMTQADLLEHSEHIFQSCSERSLATQVGRSACLSLCHGHYCCFEKDVEFGSCVTTKNSYCFVYAACENVVMDFGFTNINTDDDNKKEGSGGGGSVDVDGLNRQDLELLEETCSKENVATLEGIRDCNAFCQHHLCCFSSDEGEN